MTMRNANYLLASLLAAVTFSGCFNGVSLDIARDRQAKGDHLGAILAAQEALTLMPQDQNARMILEAESKAYAQATMDRTANAGPGGQTGGIVEASKAARVLKAVGRNQGIATTTMVSGLDSAASQMAVGEGKALEAQADAHIAKGNLDGARDALSRALFLNPGQASAREKLGQVYASLGEAKMQRKLYRAASSDLQQALTYRPDDGQVRSNLVNCHAQLAVWYGDQKDRLLHRLEAEEYQAIQKLDPNYPGIAQKIKAAQDAAMTRLAVLPLKPNQGLQTEAAGINALTLLQDKVASKVQSRMSKYMRMIDRDNLDVLMKEIYLSRSDFAQPGAELPIEAFEICDTLVTGRLSELMAMGPLDEAVPQGGSISVPLYRDQTFYNPDGSWYVAPVVYAQADVPYNYVRVTRTSEAKLTGALVVLDAGSSQAKMDKSFSTRDGDQVVFADQFSWGFIPIDARTNAAALNSALPPELVAMLQAPRTVRPADQILNGLADTITTEWATSLIQAIDTPPEIPEPYAR